MHFPKITGVTKMKKKTFVLNAVMLLILLIAGCAWIRADKKEITAPVQDNTTENAGYQDIGDIPKEQASVLAQMFVDAHNSAIKEITEIKQTTNKNLEASNKYIEAAQTTLKMLEELSKKQGSGEISIFFPENSSKLIPTHIT